MPNEHLKNLLEFNTEKKKRINEYDVPEIHGFEFDHVISFLLSVKPDNK